MTNRKTLEGLLLEVELYAKSETGRADFALIFIEAIESLEDIPFSITDEAHDWQYKIETEGDTLHRPSDSQIRALKVWIKSVITAYT
tara:strand:+ start:523 stop:783 length:261 start_codon:yes stop_codon:yes gene_type:complete